LLPVYDFSFFKHSRWRWRIEVILSNRYRRWELCKPVERLHSKISCKLTLQMLF